MSEYVCQEFLHFKTYQVMMLRKGMLGVQNQVFINPLEHLFFFG